MLSLLLLHDTATPHLHAGDALVRSFPPAALTLAAIFSTYLFFRWAYRFAAGTRRNRNS